MEKNSPKHNLGMPRKTFNVDGKWIIKPQKTPILICRSCGSRYIKTRLRQDLCLRCHFGHK